MANPTGGFGLRATRRLDGAALSAQTEELRIAYNNSHVIGKGDIVKILTTGYIDAYVAADGNTLTLGVFQGCKYFDANAGRTVWAPVWNAVSGLASGVKVYAYVILPDPQMVFEVRAKAGVTIAQANVWQNADVVVGTLTTPPGISVALLDTPTTTSTLPLRIVGQGQGVDNDNSVAQNIAEVTFNGSAQSTLTGHA